jgi:hypothetical protein
MLTGEGVVKLDPWLSPFKDSLKRRFSKTQEWIKKLNETEGGLDKFSKVRIDSCIRQGYSADIDYHRAKRLWAYI